MTLAECLERYPEHAEQLRPALQAALLTARLKAPSLPQARVQALEGRLLAEFDARIKPPGNKPVVVQPMRVTSGFWMNRAAAVLAFFFIFALGSGA